MSSFYHVRLRIWAFQIHFFFFAIIFLSRPAFGLEISLGEKNLGG